MIKSMLITSLLLLSASASAGQLLIAVAANFTGASRALVQQFQAQTGHRVKASFGSTGKLYAQIENGAPFELYLAADSKHPQRAVEQGLAVADSRFTYAKGQLVLWSAKPQRFEDAEAFLHAGTFARLALANPQTAPYGLAAKQVLQQLGLWSPLRSQLVQGDSIAQTFQFTATGNADIGFVASAQLHSWRANPANKPGTAWMIPPRYYDPIEQQAVLLNRGVGNPVAQQFLNFLKGEQGRRIISDFGYPLLDVDTDG